MKSIYSLMMVLMLGIGFAACDDNAESDEVTEEEMEEVSGTDQENIEVEPATAAEMVDGVQVITVKVEDMGYTPSRIALKEGVPAKLIFEQHGTTACAWDVMSKELGIPLTELPEGETTEVEFTPSASGEYTFTCGMDMMKAAVIVEA